MSKKKIAMYRAFISRSKKQTARDIADMFGVTRQELYRAISDIRKGSNVKLKRCMRDHKLQCLWNTKYLPWYEAVKQLRAAAAVNDKQYMFHQMVKDGFTVSHISKYTQLERATVKHHLDAYKGDNK